MTQTEARKIYEREATEIIEVLMVNQATIHRDTVRNLVKLTTDLPERFDELSEGSANKIGINAVDWAIQHTLVKVNSGTRDNLWTRVSLESLSA